MPKPASHPDLDVAGIAAARDDANGVVGVVPGARLWAVKVLNSAGSGSTSQIACGIDWITANATASCRPPTPR